MRGLALSWTGYGRSNASQCSAFRSRPAKIRWTKNWQARRPLGAAAEERGAESTGSSEEAYGSGDDRNGDGVGHIADGSGAAAPLGQARSTRSNSPPFSPEEGADEMDAATRA
ncbi:hypothetical protein C5E08_02840 [Rathayibacter iranicus]|uniref:Uncharacterized protein n=1 Tax=Rathayibacter iranicus TaxID=59737 RepID=A0AAD1AB34_9MICO|nr:hypothetical protein C7V51_02830 [Rathayibacter iranicus]PPI62557.1 hypothetical protein C5E08_02840 [Rathayibacter iranicus]